MVRAVQHLPITLGAVVGVFVGTNIDDIVVLTVLFRASRAPGRPKVWQIWVGQYLGISAPQTHAGARALGARSILSPLAMTMNSLIS
jgi:hypothetical protein